MKQVIYIYGPSGTGTSTLGRKISKELGYTFMDTDDYFWEATNPPYTTKRSIENRIALMKLDIINHENVVIAGSLVDWGDVLIPYFTLAIRLETNQSIRIERLRKREAKAFGKRIEPGGDMYQNHLDFIEWAKAYDTGDVNMRSSAKHDEWEKQLTCQRILLDGAKDLDENFKLVQELLK